MTRTLIPVDALGSPSAAAFETAVNAALAGVLTSLVGALNIFVTDRAPNFVRQYKAFIDTDTTGATTVSNPYKMKVIEADTDQTAKIEVAAFMAAHLTYWFAPADYRYSDQTARVSTRSLVFLLYNEDAADGEANWAPGYSIAGGGGTYVDPGFVNVKDSGAVGNGIADDTAAIQTAIGAAVAAGKNVLFPSGTYLLSAALTLPTSGWSPSLLGIDAILQQSNAAAFCIDFVGGAFGFLINYQAYIEGIQFSAKNGIRFNDQITAGPFGGGASGAQFFLGWSIRKCTFTGTYGAGGDPNYNTQVALDRASMIAFGVGVQLVKCFNFRIEDCWFVGLGCGVFTYGTDISTVADNRFQSNARHMWVEGVGAFGSQTDIRHNDILVNTRPYGLWFEVAAFQLVSDNYFENQSMGYLAVIGGYGMRISYNRVSSYSDGAIAWCYLSPGYDLELSHNIWQWNAVEPPAIADKLYMSSTVLDYGLSWIRCIDNSPQMPLPTYPGVSQAARDPSRFDFQNFTIIQGTIPGGYPWELDGSRWVLKQGTSAWPAIAQTIPIPLSLDQIRLRIDFFGKRGAGDAFYVLKAQYPGGAVIDLAPALGAYMGFQSATEYTTSSVWVTLPAATNKGSVTLTWAIDPQDAHIAGWHVTPQLDAAGQQFTPRTDYPALGSIVAFPLRITSAGALPAPINTSANPELLLSVMPTGGGEIKVVSRVTPTVNATIFIQMPSYGGADKYTGFFGPYGGGLCYNAATTDIFLGGTSAVRLGSFDKSPITNTDAVWTTAGLVVSGRFVFGPSGTDDGSNVVQSWGNLGIWTGDLIFYTLGKGRRMTTGAQSRFGQSTLVAGSVTIACTSVAATSRPFLSRATTGGTPGFLDYTLNPGVGFTINSTSALDTSVVNWEVVESF